MRKKQPHPEINFRLGRGRIREQRKAIAGLPKLLDLVGMTDEEKRAFAEKLRAASVASAATDGDDDGLSR